MKIFIGITQFNRSCFLSEQITRINKYLLLAKNDELIISVADNSTIEAERNEIARICNKLGASYEDCQFNEGDPSMHHSLALYYLYWKSKNTESDFSLFLDHDTFLFAPSSIIYNTIGKHFSGIGQAKLGKMYLHPNCLVISNRTVPHDIVNFTPCEGMDTGGSMSDYIATLRTDQINHLKFEYGDYEYAGTNDKYEIIGESFFHMIKGSNWNGNNKHEQRQAALFEELKRISK